MEKDIMRKIINSWINKEGYFCFGCCKENHTGVKMDFYVDGDEVVSYWKPEDRFQGWIDTLHGGIQAVLLDEICGWAVMHKTQTSGMTTKLELRYKRPASSSDAYLMLRAKVTDVRRNLVTVEASLMNSVGELCTQAVSTYFAFPPEKSEEMGFYGLYLEDKELTEAEIIASL